MPHAPSLGDPRFLAGLSSGQLHRLEEEEGTVFALWPDLTIAYVNPAWRQFAAANAGEPQISQRWSVGASVLAAIAPPVRPFFREHYLSCLQDQEVWQYDYDCSSPTHSRVFHLQAIPTDSLDALVVVNSLRVERPRPLAGRDPLEELYQQPNGLIRQCCDCRRFRRISPPHAWDWVPDWANHSPPQTSHGICPTCRAFYDLR